MSDPPVRAFLGLGSNLGDRLANLQEAVDRLGRAVGIEVLRVSRVYETAPVGPPQPDYLNAVVEVRTTLGARELLAASLGIEDAMGRIRGRRWGPRVIDIDLLTYGREQIDEPGLTVPHPRVPERAFVLVPLLELDEGLELPGVGGIASIRLGPQATSGIRPFAPPPQVPGSDVPRAHHTGEGRTRTDAPRT